MVNHRRTELEIIGNILTISIHGAKKTEILYKNNMSYAQLIGYLDLLLEKDVLEEVFDDEKNAQQKNIHYNTTKKGENLLDHINIVMSFLK